MNDVLMRYSYFKSYPGDKNRRDFLFEIFKHTVSPTNTTTEGQKYLYY